MRHRHRCILGTDDASSNEISTAATGPAWHTESAGAVAERLHTDPVAGLTRRDAGERLAADGWSDLPEQAGRSLWDMVVEQFKDVISCCCTWRRR